MTVRNARLHGDTAGQLHSFGTCEVLPANETASAETLPASPPVPAWSWSLPVSAAPRPAALRRTVGAALRFRLRTSGHLPPPFSHRFSQAHRFPAELHSPRLPAADILRSSLNRSLKKLCRYRPITAIQGSLTTSASQQQIPTKCESAHGGCHN
jgi:hypothetical protein